MHAGSSRLGLLLQPASWKSEKSAVESVRGPRGQFDRGQKHHVVGVDDQKLGAGEGTAILFS